MNFAATRERLIRAHIQTWLHQQKQQPKAPTGPVITISRDEGCGGRSIAERLAHELKLDLHGREIIDEMAADAHWNAQVVATLDEKARSQLEDWLGTTFGKTDRISSRAYFEGLKKVVFTIATHGNAIILGRGANFLISSDKRIGLRLVAPLEMRIQNVRRELGISADRAKKHILRIEKERRFMIRKYFKADIADSTHYHLVINTALVTTEDIVEIVKDLVDPQSSPSKTSRAKRSLGTAK